MMENSDHKLMHAYKRLHEDYSFLEKEHNTLKEQLSRIERQLWISQLERERYREEIAKLKKSSL